MRPPVSVTVAAHRIESGAGKPCAENLAQETAVALVYNGHSHAVMMATPADLEDFALGFSLSEGVASMPDEVRVVDIGEDEAGLTVQMWLAQERYEVLAGRSRSLVGRSGCGLCGRESLEQAIRPVRRVARIASLSVEAISAGFRRLEAAQPLNRSTGAVHAAGLLFADGTLLVREDVGRHNAVDKAIGAAWREGRQAQALLVTSRASYELVHKAAEAGIGWLAAISAPTALALRIADEAGMGLAGFARDGRLTLYSQAGRMAGAGLSGIGD